MKTILTVICASLLLAACNAPAANNASSGTANKSANSAANTANAANTAKPAADTAAVETDVKKFLADFEAALNKNDADAVGKFYDESYSLIDQNGVMQTKASRLEQIKSGKIKWEGLKFSDAKVRAHPAGDGAVIYAKANGTSIVDGKSGVRDSMVTWIARKGPDGWHFLHAQITDLKADKQ